MKVEDLVAYGIPEDAIKILLNRGIRTLNPVQVEALRKGVLGNRNVVVVAPTASGKTLVAELALVKNYINGGMGVYITPLRALASEKYEEFRVWESIGARIGITTGDYESPGEFLGRYNVLIATYERFDSLLRLKPPWLKKVRLVVIDELHMINDPERGPVLEMVVARLKAMGIRIVGLSATIGNAREIADWIGAELVLSSWRPVRLVEGVYDRRAGMIVFNDGRVERIVHRLSNHLISIVLQSVSKGHQVLVFIHNRRRVEEYAEETARHMNLLAHTLDRRRLREYIEVLRRESPSRSEAEKLGPLMMAGVAYHHAGLSNVARSIVERAFRDRLLKVVYATPTLAAGVNLPARRVIVSIKRYDPTMHRMVSIPVFEYKQMAGRAGRPQYDPVGEAIIYDAGSRDEGFKKYIFGRLEPVESKLASERSLRIHTLALIVGGEAPTFDKLIEIYRNTLFYHQFRIKRYLEDKIESIIRELSDWGMIHCAGKYLIPTRLGKVVAYTYIDPMTAHNFIKYTRNLEKPSPTWLLFMVTWSPDYMRSRPYISYKIVEGFEEDAHEEASLGLIPRPPRDEVEYEYWLQAYAHSRVIRDWINEVSEDDICKRYGIGPGDIYSIHDTASWISSGLSRVAKVTGMEHASIELEKLSLRIEYGVKEDALPLIRLKGIGRVRARTLINAGIRTLEDLARTPKPKLLSLPGFGPRILDEIKRQLIELGYKVLW